MANQQLQYAPGDPRRRRNRRRFALLFITVAIITSSSWWRPQAMHLWQRGWTAYRWHRCLAYTAPADQVVYEEDPAAARDLLRHGGYARINRSPAFANFPIAGHTPPSLDSLDAMLGWNLLNPADRATVFVHERKTPGGLRRLMIVQLWILPGPPHDRAQFRIYAVDPDFKPSFKSVDAVNVATQLWLDSNGEALKDVRVFAGQPDPADPTHLTIEFVKGGEKGMVQIWLLDSPPIPVIPGFTPTTGRPPEVKLTHTGFSRF